MDILSKTIANSGEDMADTAASKIQSGIQEAKERSIRRETNYPARSRSFVQIPSQ
jgi:hypothetical protein